MKTVYSLLFLILLASQACSRYDTESVKNNPLLNDFNTPYKTLPFNQIKPEHLLPAADLCIKSLLKESKRISKLNEVPTFENTMTPLLLEADKVLMVATYISNLNSANSNKEIQEAAQKSEKKLTVGLVKMVFNTNLIRRIKFLYDNRANLVNLNQRAAVEIIYTNYFKDFSELSFFKKLKYAYYSIKGSNLSSKYAKNILDENNAFELNITNRKELEGIPQLSIDAAAETAKKKGKEGWIFTLQEPSIRPILKYAKNRDIREKIYRAAASKGNHNDDLDNKNLIKKIIEMRIKTSQLLGYETYAHYALKNRMAKSPETVNKFIQELTDAVKPYAEKEIQEIKNYMASEGLNGEPQLWDYSYYATKMKEERYGYQDEETRPYFELNHTKQSVFDLATQLYGVTFQRNTAIQVYHQDVEAYEVFDQNKNFLGILYLDFFPREGKNPGAWCANYQYQKIVNGENIRPHISIVTNFTRPTANKPALLSFGEVSTFLHEFGHALHSLFSNVEYAFIGSFFVYTDFVELPSQIMQNWALEKIWLTQWAKHYESGEKIPEELLDKMIAGKNYFSGLTQFGWLSLDKLDMEWHLLKEFPSQGVKAFETEITKEYTFQPLLEEACISTNFSHIFAGGYAAGYYSYHWANVLDADAFILFKKNGIFDQVTANSFRKNILEKGASEPPMVLYTRFRGSEPSINAMLMRSGFKAN
jgi:peptidyl-dipeptidase Dcp